MSGVDSSLLCFVEFSVVEPRVSVMSSFFR